jgi:hypothetical protein
MAMDGAIDAACSSERPVAHAHQGQHGVAIDIPGGAACRLHAVDESASTHNRAQQAGRSNGARRPGAGDHDVRAVERAECSGTHV